MKKTVLLFSCLLYALAAFAQNEQKQGDVMVAEGNYDGAAVMYRMCMDTDDQCRLKLFKLIYEEKIERQFTDELFQLINPLATKDNAEAQYYLGVLYIKGTGGVSQDHDVAKLWLKQSVDNGYENARKELEALLPKEEPVQEVIKIENVPSANDKLAISKKSEVKGPSKLPGVLFAVGGVSIAGGAAATFLVAPKIEEDWSNSEETHTYLEIKKYNPIFIIAGAVIGGVCIGSGIVIKTKGNSKSKNYTSDGYYSPAQLDHNRNARLYFVTTENGAGFRLAF